MASTAVSAMPHSLHHLPLPPVPRIRPPRLLPGTPSPNTDPQPSGFIPHNCVWVQGKWRNPSSNAAKHQRKVVSAQVKKALRHQKHGMNIFAYYHIRTHQVVYSLTRMLDTSQIMPQLLFFGKQTKPAAYRVDHWRPYFSIQFPQTPAGQRAGLTAYQRLREFAMRRQLSPDRDSLRTTQADVDKWFESKNPVDLHVKMLDQKARPPTVGRIMSMTARAKKLMEQKASSVADAAFVLKLAVEQMQGLTVEELKDRTREKLKYGLGWRGRKRLIAIRKQEEEKRNVIEERMHIDRNGDVRVRGVGLDADVAQQVSMEFGGVVEGKENKVVGIDEFKTKVETLEEYGKRTAPAEFAKDTKETNEAPEEASVVSEDNANEIQVLWADMRDGTYAETWPEAVYHGVMVSEARAIVKGNPQWSPHIISRDGTPERVAWKARLRYWRERLSEAETAHQKLSASEEEVQALKGGSQSYILSEMEERDISRTEATNAFNAMLADAEAELVAAQTEWDSGVFGPIRAAMEEERELQREGKESEGVMARARDGFLDSSFEVPKDTAGVEVKPARRVARREVVEEGDEGSKQGIWSRVTGPVRRLLGRE